LNFPFYLAKRITFQSQRAFSGLIVKVAVITVSVGVAAMILAVAILNGFKDEVTRKQRGFFGDLMIADAQHFHEVEQTPVYFSAEDFAQLSQLEGVTDVQNFATKPGIINVNEEVEGVVLKGVDADYSMDFLQEMLVKGDVLDFRDSVAVNGEILISQYTANRLDLDLGDDFIMYFVQEPIRKRKFVIKGIFNTGSEELDKTYVVGSLPLIRRLNGWDDREVGGVELRVGDFQALNRVAEEVNDLIPVNYWAVDVKSRFPEIFQWLELLDANPQIILTLMMIVAMINMISALLIIILEKTQFIGILKALGANNREIRTVFLYHATYLMGIGLLIGNFLALGLFYFQKTTRFFKLDESNYFVSYVPVQITWQEVLFLNGSLIIIAFVVLLIPAQLISKIQPIRAIQFR
jgi:lipoprotein-releasing system permease protein